MRGRDRAGRAPGPRAWIGIDPYCVAYCAFLNPVRYSGICDLRCRTLLPQLALDTHRNEVAATLQTSEGLCVNEVTLMDCWADDVEDEIEAAERGCGGGGSLVTFSGRRRG